jgi:hypothetical protein
LSISIIAFLIIQTQVLYTIEANRNTLYYTYLGDRFTDPFYKKKSCEAVRNSKGKCIRGKNGNMLVRFENGRVVNVVARLLRKVKE